MSLYSNEIYDILVVDEFSKTPFKAVLASMNYLLRSLILRHML